MKAASYRHGVEWLALNNETAETDPEEIASDVAVCLLADLFGVEPSRVAGDVARYRVAAAVEGDGKRPMIWSRS